MKLNHQLFDQMRAATRQLLSKGPSAATNAIQQALASLSGGGKGPQPTSAPQAAPAHPAMRDINPPPGKQPARADTTPAEATSEVRDSEPRTKSSWHAGRAEHAAAPGSASEAATGRAWAQPQMPASAQAFVEDLLGQLNIGGGAGNFGAGLDLGNFEMPNFDLPGMNGGRKAPAIPEGAQFIAGSYTNHAGTRGYKLYIPSTYHGQAMPLLVMLHGCTQDPDDFAAGTQMNAVAEEKQCFVVYPAQSMQANNHKCWNWFNALDQQRGQGEPSIIAGIAQQVIDDYPVDERQVYVAGLSAGGAMAVIVGTLYPDLFAAVGVHSGLPYASAQDLPSALNAMKRGASASAAQRKHADGGSPPIIVFHGDQDQTVHPRNGEQVMEQKLRAHGAGTAQAEADAGSVPNGHRYTRTTHRHTDGTPLGEHWVVHGAGHAWSGGSSAGSYTDGKGPDASREMMRFFRTVAG
ncbi:PHB depolymerase family esterase [Pseudoduganella sp. LjRoot289]|uniref:extracellular catalytic domain type 1 short-chain-length polyhydroxyalkanoate depolymerase n=1 Tax=Pseudoduganella sp. LjRoot289 TaxID=3342314 RepID=UPI003ECEAD58